MGGATAERSAHRRPSREARRRDCAPSRWMAGHGRAVFRLSPMHGTTPTPR
jgi:hypothetical protein